MNRPLVSHPSLSVLPGRLCRIRIRRNLYSKKHGLGIFSQAVLHHYRIAYRAR